MEISKELRILRVLDGIVLDLKEKEEYDIIKKLYDGLLEEGIIPPMESIEKGGVFIGSIEGHLLYRIYLADRKSKMKEQCVNPDTTENPFEEGCI